MTAQTRRRARHDIIMRVLEVAKSGERKTNMMLKARLNFDMAERYLTALNQAGLITEELGVWRTTEKGLHVIEACSICRFLAEEAK
ncbi:MAG: transcriptional regulator [Candidatus Bathyarchaeota archaeon]|nr:MAG: transcriptional regulator [Candidatus Bathyarchaeota archaeon]